MARWSKGLAEVNMKILERTGEPVPTSQINAEAEIIFGDEWSESTRINLSYNRTALLTLGLVTHPKHGFWGPAPDMHTKLAALGHPNDGDIWNEHMRIKHGRQASST